MANRVLGPLLVLLLAGAFYGVRTGLDDPGLRRVRGYSGGTGDTVLAPAADTIRQWANAAFRGGEYLRFNVNYRFVTAGEARMMVRDTVYHGRKCYKLEFTLTSKPFFDIFYKVRDRYSSYIDAAGLFPWRFEQHIREGGYSRDFVADFDQRNHVAVTEKGSYRIPAYVQDMMSAFYLSRTIDYSGYAVGQKLHLQNFFKDSTYDLDVKFRGRQTVEVEAGKFRCIVIEPLAKEGGLFKSEGTIFIWLTDDERKLPVLVTTKIRIGDVDSELIEYVGVAGPVESKLPKD